MDDVRWLDEREQDAWRRVVRGMARLLDRLNSDLKEEGINHDDYSVLVALSEATDERLRMSDLADAVVESRSRLTHHIGRMEQRGLVSRTPCPTDRRASWAGLTPLGRATIERLAPHHVEGVRRWFLDHTDPAELDAIAEVFSRVDAAIDDAACPGTDPCDAPVADRSVNPT